MSLIDLAMRLRPIIEDAMQSVDDSTALEAVMLFPNWSSDMQYVKGQRVQYLGVLYTVLQDHTSQVTWEPDSAHSLFAKVLIPDPATIPAWEQPESTNPYMKGDKVSHKDNDWVSDIDNNVWEPGVYGWTPIT